MGALSLGAIAFGSWCAGVVLTLLIIVMSDAAGTGK